MARLIDLLMRFGDTAAATGVTPPPTGSRLWSDASGWAGGAVPGDGADVTIGNDDDVTLDTTTARLNSLIVNGSGATPGHLRISDQVDSHLLTRYFEVSDDGIFTCGNWTWAADGYTPVAGTPNPRKHTRTMIGPGKVGAVRGLSFNGNTPTANDSFANDDFGIHRGAMVMDNGQYLVNAAVPPVLNTRLQGHHYAGTQVLTLMEPVTWKAGDTLVMPPTGYYNLSKRTERHTVFADVNNATMVFLVEPLAYDRWGLLQYPTDAGISLTPGTFVTKKASATVPTIIDQRGKVFNVSRLFVVEGESDSTLTTDKIGAHEMYMDMGIRIQTRGVRYHNCGQMGLLGRYPQHFHRNAYNNDGTPKTNPWTGIADGKFAPGQCTVQDVSVTDSLNRIHSAHACKGVLFKRVIADRCAGMGFFLEDGAETENTWAGCFGTRAYDPGPGMRIKSFDSFPAVWWITHPNNKFIDDSGFKNGAADSDGPGCIVITSPNRGGYPGSCFGPSAQVPLQAAHYPFNGLTSVWEGMECHSNAVFGLQASTGLVDEEGTQANNQFQLSKTYNTGIDSNDGDKEVPTHFKGDFLWKNLNAGYVNNQFHPLYDARTMVDNDGPDFTGNTLFGEIINTLFVSESLNNWDNNLRAGIGNTRMGMIAYHGDLIAQNCSIFGYTVAGVPYPREAGDRAQHRLEMPAFMGTSDTYLFPLVGYFKDTTGNKFFGPPGPHVYINPHPTLQLLAPFTAWSGGQVAQEPGTGATAYWDPHGDMFGITPGRYALIDHPGITYGCADLQPILSTDGNYIGMTSTPTPMLGVAPHNNHMVYEDGTDATLQHCRMQRCDSSFNDVSGAAFTFHKDAKGELEVSTGVAQSGSLGGNHDMHFCLPAHGIVRLFNPDFPTKQYKEFGFTLDTCEGGSDVWVIVGVPMANSRAIAAGGWLSTQLSTRAALVAFDGSGYWRDTTAQMVWFKLATSTGWVYERSEGGFNPVSGTYFHGMGTDFNDGLNVNY